MDGPGKPAGGGGSVQDSVRPRDSPPSTNDGYREGHIQPTADPVRNKCREMIQTALNVEPEKYNIAMVSLMAAKVEGSFNVLGWCNIKMLNVFRSHLQTSRLSS